MNKDALILRRQIIEEIHKARQILGQSPTNVKKCVAALQKDIRQQVNIKNWSRSYQVLLTLDQLDMLNKRLEEVIDKLEYASMLNTFEILMRLKQNTFGQQIRNRV